MASQKTKFSVGLFVLVGIGIATVGIIWVGMSSLFQEGDYYVTFFDESVQGLDVGAPVKYRGVSVGRVEKIDVAPDSRLIEVLLKIETGQEMEKDTVAQLKNVGITGLVFVELDRAPPWEAVSPIEITFPTEHRVIPSKPSDFAEIMRGIDDVIRQVRDMDLAGISDRFKTALETGAAAMEKAGRALDEAEFKEVSRGVQKTIRDVNRILDPDRWIRIVDLVEGAAASAGEVLESADDAVASAGVTLGRVDSIVREKRGDIERALDDFGRAMENTNRLLEQGTILVGNTDASIADLRRYFIRTARNLEKASENLERLTEALMDRPSDLLFGGPPEPRRTEVEH
jgi:phospholipid/cholesterol/gamma-HCH transport system substrate-binding protein